MPFIPHTQDDLLHKHGVYFPEWIHRPGLLSRGDMLSLLARVGLPYRQFYHLKKKDEVLQVISANIGDYLAGFALTAVGVWLVVQRGAAK